MSYRRLFIFAATDSITKEQFNASIPRRFRSRVDFMLEVLRFFSLEVAKQKNRSFQHFVNKHLS